MLSPRELVFADNRGNRQRIPTGNLAKNDPVCLFLTDYPDRERLKILGQARVFGARDPGELVKVPAAPAPLPVAERVPRIRVVEDEWNCSQHIIPRFTAEESQQQKRPRT